LEVLKQSIVDATQHKRWIDWVGKFNKRVASYRNFIPEQKKQVLQELLTEVDVHLIEKQTPRLDIRFKIPLVGDGLV
jgi:hypothetical protein